MIVIAAQLENMATRRDRTLKLIFGTNELPPKQAGEILAMANSLCYLAIKPETFTKEEESNISKLKAEPVGKSKSQLLRGVLFRMWEQNNEGFDTADKHYEHHMIKIIEHFKSKLEP